MKKVNNSTVARQLIILLVGAIIVSQILTMAVFFFKTSDRIGDYDDRYVIKPIFSIYTTLKNTSIEQEKNLLELVHDDDLYLYTSKKPEAEYRIPKTDDINVFTEKFRKSDVYLKEDITTLELVIKFWFTDYHNICSWDNKEDYQKIVSTCEHYAASIEISDNRWLNIRVLPGPNELVILFPVIISAFLTIIGIVFVVSLAVRRITSPLRDLSEAANKFGRGEVIDEIEVRGPQELSTTIEAFNKMQDRLSRFVSDRTKMLASISHDLRTPITSLRLRAEFIKDQDLQNKMINTLEDMQVMVEACLNFAKQEAQEEDNKNIDLVKTLAELADDTPHIDFLSDEAEYPYVCRPVNFKRAIRNLLDNAVKYGKKATLSFEARSDRIVITVQDHGPGVPKEKIETIFEPFVRLDKERNTESGSVGLGLSITRTIIHQHGGTIKAENTDHGLQMIITLPNVL